jgi:hypothetical protein
MSYRIGAVNDHTDAANRLKHELRQVTVSCEVDPTGIVTNRATLIRVNRLPKVSVIDFHHNNLTNQQNH